MNKLINNIEQALKSGEKKEIESQVKKLQQFINSKVDYKQNAYKAKEDEVKRLISQVKSQLSQNKDKEGFFRPNNPVMWVSGVVVIGLVIGVGLLMIRVRRKRKQR